LSLSDGRQPSERETFGLTPRSIVQPLLISQQRNEFDGTEKLDRIRIRPAKWPQFSRSDEDGDISWRAIH
jgi:hypothetical protein